jgi:hypothetical protein
MDRSKTPHSNPAVVTFLSHYSTECKNADIYPRRHGFVGTNAFQRDDSSEEDSSSEQDYSPNRERINYTGLCFGVSSQMPCTDAVRRWSLLEI